MIHNQGKKTLLWMILSVFVYIPTATHAEDLQVTTNLVSGDRSEEVRVLQKALNAIPGLQLTTFGPGSPGNETNFFGALTRRAVISFQEMYAKDVLAPIGLTRGTGYVGPMTRQKLNELTRGQAGVPRTTTAPVSRENGSTQTQNTGPVLREGSGGVNVYAGDEGLESYQDNIVSTIRSLFRSSRDITVDDIPEFTQDELSLRGMTVSFGSVGASVGMSVTGVAPNQTYRIHFGDTYHLANVPGDAQSIVFKVPSIPPAVYDVAVSNSDGAVSRTRPFSVVSANTDGIRITDARPKEVEYGDEVTLTGSGFTPADNIVETAFGRITNLESNRDGTELTFTFKPKQVSMAAQFGRGPDTDPHETPITLRVFNANGVSDFFEAFTLVI